MSTWGLSITRDEDDVLEANVRHMLAECDYVWVEDRLSVDGTVDILARLGAEYGERLLLSYNSETRCDLWSRLLAMTEDVLTEGATWVVPFDTDEIWQAADGRLRDVLPTLDADHVQAVVYEHRPLPADTDASPFEAMRWRYTEKWDWSKVAVRADEGVRFGVGHHNHHGGQRPYTGDRIGMRHFPWRTPTQGRKRMGRNASVGKPGSGCDLPEFEKFYAEFAELYDTGGLDGWWAMLANNPAVVDDPVRLSCV